MKKINPFFFHKIPCFFPMVYKLKFEKLKLKKKNQKKDETQIDQNMTKLKLIKIEKK